MIAPQPPEIAPTDRRRAWLRYAVGLGLGVLIIVLLIRRVNTAELVAALKQARIEFLLLAMAIRLSGVTIKAIRWATAIEAGTGVRPRKRVIAACYMGFAGNMIFPARLGDFVRSLVLRKHNNVPATLSLASTGVTQLLDLLVVAVAFLMLVAWGVGSTLLDRRVLIALIATVGVLLVAFGVLLLTQRSAVRLGRLIEWLLDRLPGGLQDRVRLLLENLRSGAGVVGKPRYLAATLGWTLLIWTVEGFAFFVALRAFGIAVSPAVVGLLTVSLALSFAIPLTPGNVGVQQAIAQAILGLYGVLEAHALAFSFGLQAVDVIGLVSIGAVLFYREGGSLKAIAPEEALRDYESGRLDELEKSRS